ncbi:MAG TPA: response regulator [Candidatus Saccharimonadales bacterium]|nr:response regulator [Candidatus Saccharimonadales bacterium]
MHGQVPVFMPSLLSLFREAESANQGALTREQACQIRAGAVAMMLDVALSRRIDQKRGFKDLDPTTFWEDWLLRASSTPVTENLTEIQTAKSYPHLNSARDDAIGSIQPMGALPSNSNQFLFVVDDSDDDVFILSRALKGAGVSNNIDRGVNGAQAISYLQALLKNSDSGSKLPAMILLDIKMPLADGHEVLAWIRSQPALSRTPVYVLTSSELESDRSRSKQLGASDFWVKPFSYTEYRTLADKIKTLLETNSLSA